MMSEAGIIMAAVPKEPTETGNVARLSLGASCRPTKTVKVEPIKELIWKRACEVERRITFPHLVFFFLVLSMSAKMFYRRVLFSLE
jgi:hypothetical protein